MRYITLLLICLVFIGCGSTPNQTNFAQAVPPKYSLGQPDQLPRGLRVPLTFERGYLFVDTQVNGRSSGSMLLDTGSTLNIIDQGLVNRLRLPEIDSGVTVGIAGRDRFTVHRVNSLAIAGLDLGVDRAASLSMYKLTRGSGKRMSGLIGSVSLLPHPFTIDYGKKELLVFRRDNFVPPKDAEQVRLEFYGRLPAVRATLANGRDVLLIIDTGMDSAIALPMEVADWQGISATGASGAGASRGVGGLIQTKQGWLDSVAVFGHRLSGVPVSFEPKTRTPLRSDIPVGRIGGELLRGFRMTFDARYSRLWAEFAQPPSDQ